MKKISAGILILYVSVILCGCVNTSLTADVDPNTKLDALKTFYVVKQPADKSDIHQLIATELNRMGKSAEAGLSDSPTQPTDAVVSYVDKWMWDITMYLLELKVDIRDPKTNYLLATGTSYRTSLARKSPEEMVAEVLGKIFENTDARSEK